MSRDERRQTNRRRTLSGQIRDLQHQLYVVQNLLLHMSEPQPNPPPAVATKKLLDDVVARCHSPVESGPSIQVGDMRFNGEEREGNRSDSLSNTRDGST